MLAALKVAWTVLKLIPWQVYAVLGIGLAAYWWLSAHDQAIEERVTKERDAYHQGLQKKANDQAKARLARAQAEIADWVLKYVAVRDDLESQLRGEKKKLAEANADLKVLRSKNVTAYANSRCNLTRGAVLQFNAGAASANGTATSPTPAAPPTGPDLVDAPADISLDSFVAAINDTQAALGDCRIQVKGWQQFWSNVVTPWYKSLDQTLQGVY